MTSTPLNATPDRRLLGIGLVILAYTLFTGIDSSAKWLAQAGLPIIQIVFLRYAIHLALAAVIHVPATRGKVLQTSHLRLELVRACCLMFSTMCNLTAVTMLPLTVTGSIAFTMPLVLTALSIPILGEHVGWRRWTAILIGFLGILVIVRPGTDAFHPAALLPLASTVFASIYFILTRKLSAHDSIATQQLYSGLVATICFAPLALSHWVWPTNPLDWLVFFLIGIFGFSGHQLSTTAHGFAPASVLAPFAYTQIVSITAASWLIFHQPPDVWIFVGAPIIIGSGFYIWLRERKLHKQQLQELSVVD
jgi:drug/metabolite transporter (DMT)-like permease